MPVYKHSIIYYNLSLNIADAISQIAISEHVVANVLRLNLIIAI